MKPNESRPAPDCPEAFRALLAKLIQVQGLALPADDCLRMEVLAHILERYRHPLHCRRQDRLSYERFLQCGLFVDKDSFVVSVPDRFQPMGSGIAPIQYQVPLLNFLLAHQHKNVRVIEVIDQFIEKVWGQLKPLDFKQTETGATRCYTNVRFAAKVLRSYGFLRFTQREAFKTWKLTLPGILVAAQVSGARPLGESPWKIKERPPKDGFDLAIEIDEAWNGIAEYPAFLNCLEGICKPDASVFTSFSKVLKQAHAMLHWFWSNLRDEQQSQYRRRQESLKIIDHLVESGVNEKFYEELSSCICLNDELERVELRANQPPVQGKSL